jgi:hypothetical protein
MEKDNDFIGTDLDGVENDDLILDTDDAGDDELADGDAELEAIFAQFKDGDSDDEDSHEESAEEPESDEDTAFNKRLTEELNRIIPQRLSRDRKTQQVQELEQITGMTLEQIREQVIENAVIDTADRMGISEDEAREIVMQKHENAGYKAEKQTKAQEEAELSEAMKQVQYLESKTEYTRQPRLARILTKEVVAQIDDFTKNGKILSFKDGAQYILGQKLVEGELLSKMQAGAEQKAKRSAATSGGKATPKGGGGSSKSDGTGSLSRQERLIAAQLGVDPKEFAAEKIRIQNSKQRKGR